VALRVGRDGIYGPYANTYETRMTSSEKLRRVALVRTYVSEEPSLSFIRVTRIGGVGTTLAATNNRRTGAVSLFSVPSFVYVCGNLRGADDDCGSIGGLSDW
jgi:hypothetical protein